MSFQRYDIPEDFSESASRTGARLIYVTTANYAEDSESVLHTHSYSELFYVLSGTGALHTVGKHLTVCANDLFIVNPNVEHREIGINGKSLECIVLGVDGLKFSFGQGEDDRCGIVHLHNGGRELRNLLKIMLKEIRDKEDYYQAVCHDLLDVLLLQLTRGSGITLIPAQSQSRAGSECAAVRRYIDAHFQETLDLDHLAALTSLNKYYMVHSFRQEYGCSPIHYQISKRIQEGKYLLRTTDQPISRISRVLGFSSPSYFAQIFRRTAGISPAEYRKQHPENDGEP